MRFLFLLLLAHPALATTWHVGPTQTYTKPSQVANLVQSGDTVLIDAGVYANDVARWTAHNLLLRGVGGLAHLKSGGNVYGGKAIWVIVGDDVFVENIEFSEAACPDLNGAGIRSEGINLTVRHCYFHDNENGILAGDISSGDILIEYCEFRGNGYSNGLAHNLYINHAHSLTFRYNYSHEAHVGHELKSRALNNFIYCNRFSDENGTSSRSIDLPNGGFSIVLGNVIVQDPLSENSNILGYGLEGLNNPNSELYLAYNTFVNNKSNGSFIQVASGTPLLKVYNNLFAGPGNLLVGTATVLDTQSNLAAPIAAFQFVDPANYQYQLTPGSIAQGIATDACMAGIYLLQPVHEYVHPAWFQLRESTLDAGAFALPVPSGVQTVAATRYRLYPNPAQEVLLIEGAEAASNVIVLDQLGKVCRQGTGATAIDVSGWARGMYWVEIQDRGGVVRLPFVKL